jgi:ATP-dependent RNA helicase RhlE
MLPAFSDSTPANRIPSHFSDLGLDEVLLRAVAAEGYDQPTPIQLRAIPTLLQGRDLLGCAQTGTGKTAAFALPILQMLSKKPLESDGKLVSHRGSPRPIRALVLSPTRELASQIEERFHAYGRHTGLTSTVIFGGVGQMPQVQKLRSGIDILVATPGRLLDLMHQGYVHLNQLKFFVLDEADRMLDMGFVHDVKKVIAALPRQRQSLFFSATMPREIEALAATILTTPVRIAVTPVASTAERITQAIYFVGKNDKPALLEYALRDTSMQRVLVFTRTKHGANKVAKQLGQASIACDAIHGNKSQNAREAALANFKAGRTRVLVATDIAARGIDVESVTHVVNFDLPNIAESYVHRIGRTARAGASGSALSFCSPEERPFLIDIERLTGLRIPIANHPFAGRQPASVPPLPVPLRSTAPAVNPSPTTGAFDVGSPAYKRKRRRRRRPTAQVQAA